MISTGIREINKVLGGGIYPASLACLVGPAKCGKTTLCLQIALEVAQQRDPSYRILFLAGGHIPDQLKAEIKKLIPAWKMDAVQNLSLMRGREPSDPRQAARDAKADLVIADSLPTLSKESWQKFAKESGAAVLTSDDFLEDENTYLAVGNLPLGADLSNADQILRIETPANDPLARIIKIRKNRYGTTDLIGRLVATPSGFRSDDAGSLASNITKKTVVHFD